MGTLRIERAVSAPSSQTVRLRKRMMGFAPSSFLGLVALLLLALFSPVDWTAADEIFDLQAINQVPLDATVNVLPPQDGYMVEEVEFTSEVINGEPARIFAYLGRPERMDQPLPAYIWMNGGLSLGQPENAVAGARRGYVCLAMQMPGVGGTRSYAKTGGYDAWRAPEDLRTVGAYHNVVALVRAVSYLQSRPDVQPDRIGVAGSSWGGYFTVFLAGVDPRIKAASSFFGCGHMLMGCAWSAELDTLTPAEKQVWEVALDPAARLSRSKAALYIATGTDDWFYWLPDVNATYRDHGGDKRLTLLPNWDHALTAAVDEQIFAWLDCHLKGDGAAFPTVGNPAASVEDGRLRLTFETPQPTESAFFCVSYGPPGWWQSRVWHTVNAKGIGGGRWSAIVPTPMPDQPLFCYSNAVEEHSGRLVSSEVISLVPTELGVTVPSAWPATNGFVWGEVEPEGLDAAMRMYWPGPEVDETISHTGGRSIKVDASASKDAVVFALPHGRLQPLVANLLRVWCKADREDVEVKLTFGESALAVSVGTDWAELRLTVGAPPATGRPTMSVTVPAGTIVWLDDAWLGAAAAAP